jgi:hypothetical protein
MTGKFVGMTKELTPKQFLKTNDPFPAGSRVLDSWVGGTIRLHKSTYEANVEFSRQFSVGLPFIFR